MTIYIAGGITGVEDYKARFAAAQLDGALREIFGEDLVPFAERHPYVRELKVR